MIKKTIKLAKRNKRLQTLSVVIVVVAVVVVGTVLLVASHAATPYVSNYATKGTRSGTTALVSGGSDSNSQGVQFGTAPSTGTGTGGSMKPIVPNSLSGVPGKLVFDDEFSTGSLNTKDWTPYWFNDNTNQGDGSTGLLKSANVKVDSNGLELTMDSSGNGALVSSNPNGGASPGFQISPNSGGSVYVEWQATIPGGSGNAYNWPAVWLVGQSWPVQGEIDVMEGFGDFETHVEYGPTGSGFGSGISNPSAGGAAWTAGAHTFGVLWTQTGVTYVYDGKVIGTTNVTSVPNSGGALSGPMFLIMEDRGNGSPVPSTMTVRYARVWQGS